MDNILADLENDSNNIMSDDNFQNSANIKSDIELTSMNYDSKLGTADEFQHFSQQTEDRQFITQQSGKVYNTTRQRHFGNNQVFIFVKGEPLITIGPHWTFFICMFSVLLITGICLAYFIALQMSHTVFVSTIVFIFFELFVYLLTALVNPGICSTSNQLPDEDYLMETYCKVCKINKSEDVYHCPECDVCIKGYDHHCPWTGKCIGIGNIKLFYIFITSTFTYIVFCIFLCLRGI